MIIINYEFQCDIFLARCAQKIDKSQGIYFDYAAAANETSGKGEEIETVRLMFSSSKFPSHFIKIESHFEL